MKITPGLRKILEGTLQEFWKNLFKISENRSRIHEEKLLSRMPQEKSHFFHVEFLHIPEGNYPEIFMKFS